MEKINKIKVDNKIDTRIYALVPQKDNSLKRVLLSDLKKKEKLNETEVKNKMEEIIKKVFLANQHMVMKAIADELNVNENILYYAFMRNAEVRNEIMSVFERQQKYFLNKEGV